MFCSQCGKENESNCNYCGYCGYSLADDTDNSIAQNGKKSNKTIPTASDKITSRYGTIIASPIFAILLISCTAYVITYFIPICEFVSDVIRYGEYRPPIIDFFRITLSLWEGFIPSLFIIIGLYTLFLPAINKKNPRVNFKAFQYFKIIFIFFSIILIIPLIYNTVAVICNMFTFYERYIYTAELQHYFEWWPFKYYFGEGYIEFAKILITVIFSVLMVKLMSVLKRSEKKLTFSKTLPVIIAIVCFLNSAINCYLAIDYYQFLFSYAEMLVGIRMITGIIAHILLAMIMIKYKLTIEKVIH